MVGIDRGGRGGRGGSSGRSSRGLRWLSTNILTLFKRLFKIGESLCYGDRERRAIGPEKSILGASLTLKHARQKNHSLNF